MKSPTSDKLFLGIKPPTAPEKPRINTLVVSDIHLGSNVNRAEKLTEMIRKQYSENGRFLFDQLILLGDIFEDLNLTRLKKKEWEFLSLVRELSDPGSGVKVIWIKGNHDAALSEVAQNLFGAPVFSDYEWDYEGKRFIATHGDIFDKFISAHPALTDFFTWIYLQIQKVDSKTQAISRFIKRVSKKIYLSSTTTYDTLAYAREKSADVIFCGHTHHADAARAHDGIEYYNSGCWTDIPSTYLTVGEEGVNIHEVW